MYCEICERMSQEPCRECELRHENGVLRETLNEKDRMIETLMREPRLDREAHLRSALAAANDENKWIGIANMWREKALHLLERLKAAQAKLPDEPEIFEIDENGYVEFKKK